VKTIMTQKKNILFFLAPLLVSSGCAQEEQLECRTLQEPGEYEVHACDVFTGPFGTNALVTGVDKNGIVSISYISPDQDKLFDDSFSRFTPPEAHYGINIYHQDVQYHGTMVRTDNAHDLYYKCVEAVIDDTDPRFCSLAAPTEALPGDIMEISPSGDYFGKTNNPEFPQLASCNARNLESIAIHSSAFLGLPQLEPGVSLMDVFMDNPDLTGSSSGSRAVWYHDLHDKKDAEAVEYKVKRCNEKLEEGHFLKGDHEVTHLFLRGMSVPSMFNEGLANYVPTALNTTAETWDTPDSVCREEGLVDGFQIVPYTKYDQMDGADPFRAYTSGECFWVKLTHDHGEDMIPLVMNVLYDHKWEPDFTFENALTLAGAVPGDYAPWGLK